MATSDFEGMDSGAIIGLTIIEDEMSYNFRKPMLLLEALQFPGSRFRRDDYKDNMELQLIGDIVLHLVAVAGEYELGCLRDPGGNFHPG